jgi:hypothetical protein
MKKIVEQLSGMGKQFTGDERGIGLWRDVLFETSCCIDSL